MNVADPKAPTSHDVLVVEQDATLAARRRRYGPLARMLFATVGAIYGRPRSLETFRVLEIVARVPYQAWENVGYVAITHTHERVSFARRVFDYVEEARSQQDNEQWHLLVLEDLLRGSPEKSRGFFFGRVVPQVLALVYYHLSWLLYVVAPRLSYALNADFEDHAEHEYMEFVREHPELETRPWRSPLARDYGRYATVADVLRRIGLDERVHKEESLVRLLAPRFQGVAGRSGDLSIS
jgi:ubiquinol oxidase